MTRDLDRRAFLGVGGGLVAASVLAACTGGDGGAAHPTPLPSRAATTTTTGSGAVAVAALTPADFAVAATCRPVPEKTAGPFPLDRQLDRRTITEHLPGRPLRLGLRVVD